MIRSNKKLYYLYFDLYRISTFLSDIHTCERANLSMKLIKEHFETDIVNCTLNQLRQFRFPENTICEITEYKDTSSIIFIDHYKSRVDTWLRQIILPDFFDLIELRKLFSDNHIKTKSELIALFESNLTCQAIGTAKAELCSYFVSNIDGSNFPIKYRKKYDDLTEMITEFDGKCINGNFHNHTPYSDGKCHICDLKQMAIDCNRTFIGISDHSKKLNGIDEKDIDIQHREIDLLNEGDDNFTILKSVECEILKDGTLDFSNDDLRKFDYVIAAVHRDTSLIKNEATHRLIKAIENDYTNILAHPSSRMYGKNVGLFLDMKKVIDACIANRVVIEINGDSDRLDLDPSYIEYAVSQGAIFSLDSDTHSYKGFMNINNAIQIAKDKRIPSERIINTWELSQVMNYFKAL